MSGIWLLDCSKLAVHRKNDSDVTICWHDVIVNFFDVVLFLLYILVTGPSFMSIVLLVLELWQFSFMRDWPEIRKSEIPTSEFCPILPFFCISYLYRYRSSDGCVLIRFISCFSSKMYERVIAIRICLNSAFWAQLFRARWQLLIISTYSNFTSVIESDFKVITLPRIKKLRLLSKLRR